MLAMHRCSATNNTDTHVPLTCLLDCSQSFDSVEAVLRGVRRMAAQQLAAEPAVRQFVREHLAKEAVISTSALPPNTAAVDGLVKLILMARRGRDC